MTEINKLTYGNPTIEEKKLIEKSNFLDGLFLELKRHPFPFNGSELVKDELNEIVDFTSSMELEENDGYLKRYKGYDRSLLQFINSSFKQKGIDTEQITNDVVSDISGLITKLKYFYQRPRPNQLAQAYKLKLFPYKSYTANSPSYPSKSTVEAFVVLNVIGNRHPTFFTLCKEMIDDIAYSRCYLGLNYQTDIDFSKEVGKAILKNKEFSKKYQI